MPRIQRLILFVILVFSILLFARIMTADCSGFNDVAVIQDEIVSETWPAPNVKLPIKCYYTNDGNRVYLEGRGIGATLITVKIDEFLETPPQTPLEERAYLLVNGRKLDESPLSVGGMDLELCPDGQNCTKTGRPAGTSLSWRPFLILGNQNVTLEVMNDAGDILEYTWTFSIIW